MRADPTEQARLLQLQQLDTTLSQLEHRLRGLPEHALLVDLEAQAREAEATVVVTRTAHDDVQRELVKAEADVQLVRDRAARDQAKMDSGQGSARDLQGLQHELESLARRQGILEDEELEVMERAEGLAAEAEQARSSHGDLLARVEQVRAELDVKAGEVGAERDQVAAGREALVAGIPEELVTLYEKIRTQSGSGAAPLVARRCGGCQLELNNVELGRIKAADDDEVLRCEECRRILVRTVESGL